MLFFSYTGGFVKYSIPTEFGVAKKQFKLSDMCLDKPNVKFRIGKYLSDTFSV
jgi:hypothetical protein